MEQLGTNRLATDVREMCGRALRDASSELCRCYLIQ
jgi:hypothetical protein